MTLAEADITRFGWNKLVSEYIGKEKLEELIVDNFDKGYIDFEQVAL